MTIARTTDICDACAEAQACELAFIGVGRRRAAGAIRAVRYRQGLREVRDTIADAVAATAAYASGNGSSGRG